jgi:hypothetical protein
MGLELFCHMGNISPIIQDYNISEVTDQLDKQ